MRKRWEVEVKEREVEQERPLMAVGQLQLTPMAANLSEDNEEDKNINSFNSFIFMQTCLNKKINLL